ncbi:MAG: hypothetical protein J5959_16215 [Butyrivibrio sp.]|nr:hypothetical protein [Butyrivibrio sp.]
MVIIITGASHVGKTVLAQRILDGYISNGEHITLITENYDDSIRGILY